jgi:Family of unknown function (DUF5681)
MQTKKARGRPFEPGQSGNPSGRPKGARNKATVVIEALLEDKAEPLTRKLIELALGGNMAALRLCFGRLLPPRRDHGVAFDLPKIESAADEVAATRAVLESCAAGTLSPSEGAVVMGLIASLLRAIRRMDPLFDLERLMADEIQFAAGGETSPRVRTPNRRNNCGRQCK